MRHEVIIKLAFSTLIYIAALPFLPAAWVVLREVGERGMLAYGGVPLKVFRDHGASDRFLGNDTSPLPGSPRLNGVLLFYDDGFENIS